MNRILLLILSILFLFSCRSVQKNKNEEKTEEFRNVEMQTEKKSEIKKDSEKTETNNSKFDLTQFSITPGANGIADFSLSYGGQLISGQTTGVLNFSNEKKEQKTEKTDKENYSEAIETKTQMVIRTIKTTYNIKETITREVVYSWQFWVCFVALIIIGWKILEKAVSTALKSQWWLQFINRFKQVR